MEGFFRLVKGLRLRPEPAHVEQVKDGPLLPSLCTQTIDLAGKDARETPGYYEN